MCFGGVWGVSGAGERRPAAGRGAGLSFSDLAGARHALAPKDAGRRGGSLRLDRACREARGGPWEGRDEGTGANGGKGSTSRRRRSRSWVRCRARVITSIQVRVAGFTETVYTLWARMQSLERSGRPGRSAGGVVMAWAGIGARVTEGTKIRWIVAGRGSPCELGGRNRLGEPCPSCAALGGSHVRGRYGHVESALTFWFAEVR